MVATGKVCQGRNARDEPCGAYAIDGSDFCYWHSPDMEDRRRESAARGGRSRHGRTLSAGSKTGDVSLESVADVVSLLEDVVRDLFSLENSIARGRAVGYICGLAVRALEVSDLEARIVRLEELVK